MPALVEPFYRSHSMILLFTVSHPQHGFKSFSFRPSTLEVGLDFMSQVGRQGDKIISAHLIEKEEVTKLSVEAFDGQSFSKPMGELAQQWTTLLAPPLQTSSPAKPSGDTQEFLEERIDQLLLRIESKEKAKVHLVEMLTTFEGLHHWAQTWYTPRQTRLLERYQAQIDFFTAQVKRSVATRAQLALQLTTLLDV